MRYSVHARERMVERRISEAEVEAVLADPDLTYHDRKGNPNFVRRVSGRPIRVVVARDRNPTFIITVIGD